MDEWIDHDEGVVVRQTPSGFEYIPLISESLMLELRTFIEQIACRNIPSYEEVIGEAQDMLNKIDAN